MSPSLADHDLPDRCATNPAGFAFSAVHVQLILVTPRLSFAIPEVAHGRAAKQDSSLEGLPNRFDVFIEPDEDGDWRIAFEIERWVITSIDVDLENLEDQEGKIGTDKQSTKAVFDKIVRVELYGGEMVPEDEKRDGSAYSIMFVNSWGDTRSVW